MYWFIFVFFFFFFQAEDGIRDTSVTGVQTCALPILRELPQFNAFRAPVTLTMQVRLDIGPSRERQQLTQMLDRGRTQQGQRRSEERRVGKECRSRWSQGEEKKRERDEVIEREVNKSW